MTAPRRVLIAFRACLAAFALVAAAAHAREVAAARADAPVEVRVPWAPAAVVGSDAHAHLAYELHITNFYRDTGTLRLRRIEVFADAATAPLATFEGAALTRIVSPRPGDDDASAEPVAIAAGLRVVAFVWLTLPDGSAAPKSLRHRLEFETASGARVAVDGVPVAPVDAPSPAIGPPLRSGAWLVVEGPGNARSHHWGSLVAVNGAVTIPQRYALDLFGLDDDGRLLRAGVEFRHSERRDWIGDGVDVLAVADGTVSAVRDGADEHVPLAPQPEPASLSADSLYGNYVVLQIAPSLFVHYAHLQRGSVRVKPGQRVRRGDLLGQLGQSGNSNGPHLHLQVSDAAVFEGSEGVPFVFDAFASPGAWSVESALDRSAHLPALRQAHAQQMPLDGDVLMFSAPAAH